jgi:hypothetical protein
MNDTSNENISLATSHRQQAERLEKYIQGC